MGFQLGNTYASRGKGKPKSAEHRRKISLANLGHIISEETKKKISESGKGKHSHIFGDKHPGWKGGVSKDKEYVKNYHRMWRERNREKRRASEYKRKFRLEIAGSHSLEQWLNLKSMYKNTCPCCFKVEPKIKLTKDHIVPLSLGGTNFIENIQPLCVSCNCKKHTKTIKYHFDITK